MLDTNKAVIEFVQKVYDKYSNESDTLEFAGSYGEPGYSSALSPERLIVLGNHWCKCDRQDMHTIDKHYPHAFQALEDSGVEFEWYDEWTIDYENDKAYRSSPDSYSWQPSFVYSDDGGIITPDDDIDVWIDWALNNVSNVIPSVIYSGSDLEDAGFEKFNAYPFQNGFHEGMDETPEKAVEKLYAEQGNDVEFVFSFQENSQFYIGFDLYYRSTQD